MLTFVFRGRERVGIDADQDFQDGWIRSVRTSVMNGIHAPTVTERRGPCIAEQLGVFGHLCRIGEVTGGVKVQGGAHLIVLLEFSGRVSVNEGHHDVGGCTIGAGVVQGQPPV